MAKVRVYELAKELNVKPKELLELLVTIGVNGKVPSSSIEETAARSLRQMIENKLHPAAAEPAPTPTAPPEPTSFKTFRASEFRAHAPVKPKPSPARPQPVVIEEPASDEITDFRADEPEEAPTTAPPESSPESSNAGTAGVTANGAAPPAAAPRVLPPSARRPLGPGRRPGSGRGGDFRRYDDRNRGRGRYSREEESLAPEAKAEPTLEAGSTVTIPQQITTAELAEKIGKPVADLIKRLFAMNIMRAATQPLESDVAGQLLSQFGYKVEVETARAERHLDEDDFEALVDVPPVVTIMGHVDHGKTSLLDIIRSANVQSGEAGGITQRIGAYETEHNGETIVFLDTPGHEAFTRMRARGAHVTDIAILVVAADDGVMPQTREAIDHARAAKVPIIVAINKMDKADADPERVKGELAEAELIPEDYGGDVITLPVSAKTGQGVQELLDMVLLVAELQELKANPEGEASGTIIEAQQDPQRGAVATVLVHRGTLRVGDHIVVGDVNGRVRAMYDYKGDEVQEAGPKKPVSLIGLSSVPHASDTLRAMDSARQAREAAEQFRADARAGRDIGSARISLQDFFAQMKQGTVKELNVIIKADGQGSVEALAQSLEQLAHEEVRVKIISRGVGNVSENDVNLASAASAIVIGFAVGVDNAAASLADREKIEVRSYNVIYDAINDVKDALEGMLAPVFEEKYSGEAEVVAMFSSSRAGQIAGCRVRNGKLVSGGTLRVQRRGQQVYEGKVDSLRHVKDIVKEIPAPQECGVSVSGFNSFQEGDILQCFVQEQVKRTI
jgi:translation initiation factor IF-2